MTSSPRNASIAPHDSHDLTAIAALAGNDLETSDRTRALSLVAECALCEQLLADLRLIAAAVVELPPSVVPSGRSFQLNLEDARRLDRRNGLGFLRWFGSARGSLVRPLAGALMTLGLAGFIISTQPLVQFGATTAAPRDAAGGAGSFAPPAYTLAPEGLEPVGKPLGGATAAPATDVDGRLEGASGNGKAASPDGVVDVATSRISWPLVSAVTFLIGAMLLALRRIAVRPS